VWIDVLDNPVERPEGERDMSKSYNPSGRGYGDKKGKGKTEARRLQRHRDLAALRTVKEASDG
jgi:hypothetical protein